MTPWPIVRLGDCCEIVSGATPRRDHLEYWGGEIAWVTPKDIRDLQGSVLFDTPEKITQEGYASCSARLLPIGSVLFSSRAPIGLVAVTGREMCTNQGFKSLVPGATVDAHYLYWCMRRMGPSIAARSSGTTFAEISLAGMQRVQIPLPPLPEQRRIAAILDKADAVRRKRQQTLDLADQFLRSAFLDMFGDPVTNPKGWPVRKLGDLCDVRDGTHESPKYVSEGGYPLVTSKNLTRGCVDLVDARCISEEDYAQINRRSKVDRGDILMPMIGTVGSPILVDHNPAYAIKNVALVKFSAASPSPVFVVRLLRSHYFEYAIRQTQRGGTQKFVSLGNLRSLPIPLPESALQRRFDALAYRVGQTKETLSGSGNQLQTLLASCQQRAFRGGL